MHRWCWWFALALGVLGGGAWGLSSEALPQEVGGTPSRVADHQWEAGQAVKMTRHGEAQRGVSEAQGDDGARGEESARRAGQRPVWLWGIQDGDTEAMVQSWVMQWRSQGYRQELVRELASQIRSIGDSEVRRVTELLQEMGLEAVLVDVMLTDSEAAAQSDVRDWVERVSAQCKNSVACFSLLQVATTDMQDFLRVREAARSFEAVCGPVRTVEDIKAASLRGANAPWCV